MNHFFPQRMTCHPTPLAHAVRLIFTGEQIATNSQRQLVLRENGKLTPRANHLNLTPIDI